MSTLLRRLVSGAEGNTGPDDLMNPFVMQYFVFVPAVSAVAAAAKSIVGARLYKQASVWQLLIDFALKLISGVVI